MIEVKKKEGESSSSLLFRFSKKVRQSGRLVEARRRRFRARAKNKRARRASAIYRDARQASRARMKKLGLI